MPRSLAALSGSAISSAARSWADGTINMAGCSTSIRNRGRLRSGTVGDIDRISQVTACGSVVSRSVYPEKPAERRQPRRAWLQGEFARKTHQLISPYFHGNISPSPAFEQKALRPFFRWTSSP